MVEWTRTPQSVALYAFGKETVPWPGPGSGADSYRLHVNFRIGPTYVYNVPVGIYEAMKNAPSKGRYYVFVVKARWDYIRKY